MKADKVNTSQETYKSKLAVLKPKEMEVFLLIGQGMSTQEIASKLDFYPSEVPHFLHEIYQKLGVDSRAEIENWYKSLDESSESHD